MDDDNAHLHPDFDANSVKMADLRRILIEHDIPAAGASKKSELVQLYEQEIRPRAAKILAKRERVRASSRGIEDARETVTSPKSRASATPARSSRKSVANASQDEQAAGIKSPEVKSSSRSSARKSMSMGNLAAIADSGPALSTVLPKKRKSVAASSTSSAAPTRTSMRRSASVDILSEQDEEEGDADMEATPGVSSKKRSSSSSTKTNARSARPSSKPAVDATVMEVDEPEDIRPAVVPEKAVARRKSTVLSPTKPVVEIPYRRPASDVVETGLKRKLKPAPTPAFAPVEDEETKAESGFSDYNPFQDSPDREQSAKKRRKSSLGPSASTTNASDEVGSGIRRSATMQALGSKRKSTGEADDTFSSGPSSARKSLSSLGSRDSAVPAVPAIPAAYAAPAGPSRMSSSKSMSSLSKASSTPLQGLRTRPEDFSLSLSPTKQETLSEARSPKKASPTKDVSPTLPTPRGRGRQSMPSSIVPSERQTRSSNVPDLTKEDLEVLDDLSNEPLMAGREVATDDDDEDSVTVAASRAPETSSRVRKVSSDTKPVKRGPPPPERAVAQAAETVVTPAKTQGVVIRPAKSALPKAVQTLGAALPLLALFGSYGKYWAAQKQTLGFCDTEASANRAVIHQRMQQLTAPKPYTSNPAIDSLLKDSIDYLTPNTCEPCPPRAVCEDGQVKSCTKDYILQPNAVAFLFSDGLDPQRSVAPVLFKPYCRPDTERLVRVAETASQISAFLRAFKGNIICSGEEKARRKSALKDRNGQPEEWAVYGASQDWLKKVIYDKKNPRIPDASFDDIFEQAVLDLISHNEVIHGIDQEAEAWVSAIAADLPLGCRTRLAAYNAAAEHKASLAGLAAALLAALYGRLKLAQRKAIGEQVEELVPIALQLLQAQEQNHHIDNVIHPTPYLAPAQLRDLVLSHEHSPSRRAELWKRVEKVVEGNSNVRAKVAEQHGEEMRVWQWVGGSYGLLEDEEDMTATPEGASVRRRKSYGGLTARSSLSRPGTPRINTPGRHITWSKDVRNQDSPL